MTLLHCLGQTDSNSVMWISELVTVSLYFLGLFFFNLIPMRIYHVEFRLLPEITRLTRIGLAITLIVKSLGDTIGILVGAFSRSDDEHLNLYGLICMEFPAYLISSCYTLVVMNWLSSCVQIFPYKYVKVYRRIKSALISYNAFVYFLFASDIIVVSFNSLTERFCGYYVSSTVILRDVVLCVIFVVFVVCLKISHKRDNYKETDPSEHNLFMYTTSLSICVLIRSVFSTVYGLWYRNTSDECRITFFVWKTINEIVIEGLPLALLIHSNNRQLMKQRSTTYELNPALLGTTD